MEWSPLPLRMGLSLRSHSKGHGRIPHSIQEEMVNLHFHSKESSELASFLLSEVEIPPFLVEWEWSGRHFPLEWDWHSIPTLRGTGESPTSFRREWSTSIFHSRDSLLLSEVEIPLFLLEWEWSAISIIRESGERAIPTLMETGGSPVHSEGKCEFTTFLRV